MLKAHSIFEARHSELPLASSTMDVGSPSHICALFTTRGFEHEGDGAAAVDQIQSESGDTTAFPPHSDAVALSPSAPHTLKAATNRSLRIMLATKKVMPFPTCAKNGYGTLGITKLIIKI